MEIKYCKSCNREKSTTEFHKNRKKKDGLSVYCGKCSREKSKQTKLNNPKKYKNYMKDYMKTYNKSNKPYVYRIKVKNTGEYYIGNSALNFKCRIGRHFAPSELNTSYFSGMNRNNCEIEILCYCSSKKQSRVIEKALLETRVGIDPLCLNKYAGGK